MGDRPGRQAVEGPPRVREVEDTTTVVVLANEASALTREVEGVCI
ncbi:hypothetical protein [Streptosporangium sandarakinum]